MVKFGSLRLATEPAAAREPRHRTLAEGGRLGLGLVWRLSNKRSMMRS